MTIDRPSSKSKRVKVCVGEWGKVPTTVSGKRVLRANNAISLNLLQQETACRRAHSKLKENIGRNMVNETIGRKTGEGKRAGSKAKAA